MIKINNVLFVQQKPRQTVKNLSGLLICLLRSNYMSADCKFSVKNITIFALGISDNRKIPHMGQND